MALLATLRVGGTFEPDYPAHDFKGRARRAAAAETRAMKAVARTGKPAGYSWRWWHEWDGPKPRKVPMTPIRRAWVDDAAVPAYKKPLPERDIREWKRLYAAAGREWPTYPGTEVPVVTLDEWKEAA